MVRILHGDNTVASRNELTRLKTEASGKEIRDIDGKHATEQMLRQALESSSLFGNTLLVVIENLFTTLGKKQKEVKTIANVVQTASGDVDVILWEPKELGKTVLGYFPKANVALFKMPVVLFEFLDSIKPGGARQTLSLLEKTLEKEPEELILYMIQSRVRQLITAKDNALPSSVSPWQRSRLTNQSKSFTMDKLLFMHKQILAAEYSFKTGTTPLTLTQLIIEFIISI